MTREELNALKYSDTDEKILKAAYSLYVEKKIEGVEHTDVANRAGVGRMTVFRHYPSKADLVVAVSIDKWKQYLYEMDMNRAGLDLESMTAIERLELTLDVFIDLYINHKELLMFSDNFNHYMFRVKNEYKEQIEQFVDAMDIAKRRFEMIYNKALIDKSINTDFSKSALYRISVQMMMAASMNYIGGIVWGTVEGADYSKDLIAIKEMILDRIRA